MTTAALTAGSTTDVHTYGFSDAARILEVSESRLRYWAQVGAVGPSARRGTKQFFSFSDLVSVKAFKELTDRGIRPAAIRKALEGVRAALPEIDRPLDKLRVAFDGETLVVLDAGLAFAPDGQRVFDFGLKELADRVAEVHAMAPAPPAPEAPKTPRTPLGAFTEGLRLLDLGEAAAAERAFTEALAGDPGLAAAHTNLGLIAHARGDASAARAAFKAALALDPDQPEARSNLARLDLEDGDVELAIAELRRVLIAAPDFADAHFHLAVALERLGGRAQARAHLERFLALTGPEGADAPETRALAARL